MWSMCSFKSKGQKLYKQTLASDGLTGVTVVTRYANRAEIESCLRLQKSWVPACAGMMGFRSGAWRSPITLIENKRD